MKATNDIFGTSINPPKRKTVQKSGEHVRLDIEIIPDRVLDRYKNVTLADDIIFVNNIRFFITISRHMQFGAAEIITDEKTRTMIQSVVNMIRV